MEGIYRFVLTDVERALWLENGNLIAGAKKDNHL